MNTEERRLSNDYITSELFFRLLPVQILLVAIPSLNGIISSLYGSNMLGADSVSAIGMYSPIAQFLTAIGTLLLGGSQILCGKYMGSNQTKRMQQIFMMDVTAITVISVISGIILFCAGMFDLTGFMNADHTVRALFNKYLIGTAFGILPMLLGNQLSGFLSLEMQGSRSTIATLVFAGVNLILSFLLLNVFHMGILGLALAASIGYWVYFLIQFVYYFSGKSILKVKHESFHINDFAEVIKIGIPGALVPLYMTIRRLVMNSLILTYVGSVGLSAFAAADTLLGIFWAVPLGMAAVGRMLMSVSVGEEDRQTLKDIVKDMLTKGMAIVTGMAVLLILCAVPLTRLYYRDTAELVYALTLSGFRLLPLSMPLGLFCLTVTDYAQVLEKHFLVHSLSLIDGVLAITISAIILVPHVGMNGIYYAIVINGIITVIYPCLYSIVNNKGIPKTMDQWLMIPDAFGALESERMDISLHSMDEVINISRRITEFCHSKNLDERRSYLSGLCLEEMAGNVIEHGFTSDKKSHSVDVRVVHKDDSIILRIRDDCVPFNPSDGSKLVDPEDPAKNIGLRMVFKIAQNISYQNIFGMNVLTIRI